MAAGIQLPVTRVIVMEDRAQVERSGTVTLSGGPQRFEIAGVSLVAADRSLEVEVQGGTFVDAKFVRRWRERPRGGLPADASALHRQVDALEQEVAAGCDEVARLETRVALLAVARGDLLRAIAEGAGHGQSDAAPWREPLATLSARQAEADEALRGARQRKDESDRRLAEAQAARSLAEEPERDLESLLAVTIEGNGPAQVRVRYLVPCAAWRPAYRATLNGEAVLLETEAVVWQCTGEAWPEVALQFSTARPTLGTAPPQLSEDLLRTRDKQASERKVVDVTVREEVIQAVGESGGSAELPGLDDGGEVRLIDAPARATVQSDGQPHRVPLFAFEAKAQLERVCPAELSGMVFLVARFANPSRQVLLAGPVDLVRQAGFVGRAQLRFAAPGETVKLSFGSEDGLQVVREVVEAREEGRLTGRKTTTRTVTLHVSNARPEPAALVVEERIPVSEVKGVEVAVLTKECRPTPAPVTRDGIARIALELQANATTTARFSWELSAASHVAGA